MKNQPVLIVATSSFGRKMVRCYQDTSGKFVVEHRDEETGEHSYHGTFYGLDDGLKKFAKKVSDFVEEVTA